MTEAEKKHCEKELRIAMFRSIKAGSLPRVKFYLMSGVSVKNPPGDGYTALKIAIRENRLDIVKVLVEAGADINYRNKLGNCILFDAVCEPEILKYFIDKGADISVRNCAGTCAFTIARMTGCTESQMLLMSYARQQGYFSGV